MSTYWEIGRHIVEFEQKGEATAEYGSELLATLSRALKLRHGRGFSLSNLKRFRQFYLTYRSGATLSHQLSWSHYVELLKISNDTERQFYMQQSLAANWSVRELMRQKETGLLEYATYGIDANLFVQKYQLYLPNEQELRHEIEIVLAEQKNEI